MSRQEAKRKKPLPPTPAIVGKGSAFTQEVWQNAALLVDKPKGWTSFDVCAKLRGALKTKKVLHPWLNSASALIDAFQCLRQAQRCCHDREGHRFTCSTWVCHWVKS